MLVMVNALPIAVEDVVAFEQLLQECDEQFNGTRPTINPMEFETHYDPNMVGRYYRGGFILGLCMIPTLCADEI